MRMRRWLVFLALLGACGGRDDAGVDAAVTAPGQPPPEPQTTTPPTKNVYTFAMHELFFGDTPRDSSSPTTTAWQTYGYNLDGKVTSADSTDVCALFGGAPRMNQKDGLNGIDNAWGAIIVPNSISSEHSSFTQTLTANIQEGRSTVQFQVVGLSDDPEQSSTGLRAQMFLSGAYGDVPAFDLTTDWPVLSSSLADESTIAGGAKSAFPNAYINAGVFVSGKAPNVVELDIDINGVNQQLMLHDAVFTFVHADHASAIDGIIAGVLDTQELCEEAAKIAGRISQSLCSAMEGVFDQLRSASDILSDGSNAPGVPCTAISVGFGFNAVLVANPTKVVQAPVPPPDLCAD